MTTHKNLAWMYVKYSTEKINMKKKTKHSISVHEWKGRRHFVHTDSCVLDSPKCLHEDETVWLKGCIPLTLATPLGGQNKEAIPLSSQMDACLSDRQT